MRCLVPTSKPPAPRAVCAESMLTTLLSLPPTAPCDESVFRIMNHSDAIYALMSTLVSPDQVSDRSGFVNMMPDEEAQFEDSLAQYNSGFMNLFGTDVSLTHGSDGVQDDIKNLISNNQDKAMNNLFSNLTNVNTNATQSNKSLASIFSSTISNNKKKTIKEPKKAPSIPTPSIFMKNNKFDENNLPEFCHVIGSPECSIESFIQILTRTSKTRISICLLWDT